MKTGNEILSEEDLSNFSTDVQSVLLKLANENPERVEVLYTWFCKLIDHPKVRDYWKKYSRKGCYVEHPESKVSISGKFRFLGINWEII